MASFFGTGIGHRAGLWSCRACRRALGYGQPLHLVLYAALILGFASSTPRWCSTRARPRTTSRSRGAFIPGIRPGPADRGVHRQGADAADAVGRAVHCMAVCLLPEFLVSSQGVPFQFGGTSLLIVVVVVMDFMAQLQAHLMSHQYQGLMKKANLLGRVAAVARVRSKVNDESTSIGQEDLQELQDRAPSRRGLRDLHRRASQAAPRLEVEVQHGTYCRHQHSDEQACR